jgi:hypothetical protein
VQLSHRTSRVDAYVIRLYASATLECTNCTTIYSSEGSYIQSAWASERGLGIGEDFIPKLFGPNKERTRVAANYVVMPYDEFIDWATSRDEELLQFILDQF